MDRTGEAIPRFFFASHIFLIKSHILLFLLVLPGKYVTGIVTGIMSFSPIQLTDRDNLLVHHNNNHP